MMARTMTSEECQELGRRFYKLKQFDKALDTLSQGIEASPTLGLYDHRAAAYDKLGDYNSAVKDGREMIKLDKKEIKGYLRTASVLEKMDRPETALGIYKYGMKNVPVGDRNFKLLQQLHDKLTRKLSPAAAIDPMTVFPVELAEMILEYLSFRQLVNCMRVSRGWRDYLSKMPKLWMHLDLSGARRPVPRPFVKQAVKRSEDRLSRITIHRFEHIDMLQNIAKLCKNLTHVEIISLPHAVSSTLVDMVHNASNLRSFVVRPEITFDTATAIMQLRAGLEYVSFQVLQKSRHTVEWKGGPWPNLKTFELNATKYLWGPDLGLSTFLARTPALETLRMLRIGQPRNATWLQGLTCLTTLEMKATSLVSLDQIPASLQSLTIECDGVFDLSNTGEWLLRCRLPDLKHLSLHNFSGIHVNKLEELLTLYLDNDNQVQTMKNAASLQSLSLRGVLHEDTTFCQFISGIITHVPRVFTPALRNVDIATLPCDDDAVETLLTCGLWLETIDISHSHVTGASIKMLADKLKGTLKVIHADGCARINGRDAVNYAERKGIHVSCRMSEGQGGRRVRYG